MENSWHHHDRQQQQQHTKCVSSSSSSSYRSIALQTTPPPPPLHDNFPQAEMKSSNKTQSRSIIHGRIQDNVFYNTPSSTSYKSGHPDLGSSYLAFLSGPPSLLHYDFRELADQTQLTTMSPTFPFDNGLNSIVGNGLKVRPSHNSSQPKLLNRVNLCSVVSSKSVTSSINSISALHNDDQMAQLNSQNSDISRLIQLTLPCDRKAKDTSTGHGKWQSNPTPSQELYHRNMDSSRKLPLEVNSLAFSQSFALTRGCPRVFCMGKSGDLLMSNTGLLGVVCSCHSSHMSITKFCEHSGLHEVNPGDAVRMIGGETISQWRKVYFGKLGIRVPEEQSGWDWPEVLSITCHSLKSSASSLNTSDNSDSSHLVTPNEGSSRPRQPYGGNIFLKNPYIGNNLVTNVFYNNEQRNVQATGSSLIKGFLGTLQGDLHDVVENQIKNPAETRHLTIPPYFDERSNVSSQCFPAFRDPATENKTSSITLPGLQNIRTLGRNYDSSRYNNSKDDVIVDREAATSNIELRLGQPCQQSGTMGNPVSSLVGSESLGTLVYPVTSISPERMTQKTAISEGKLENRNYFHSTIGQSNSRTIKEPNQLNLGNNLFVNRDTTFPIDTNKFNMVKSSNIPVLPSFELPTEQSVHLKPANIIHGKEHFMSDAICTNAQTSSCGMVELVRKLNLDDKGIAVGSVADGSHFSADSNISICNQVESSRSFAEVDERACCRSSAVNVKNINTPQLSCSQLDVYKNQSLLNSTEKIPSFGNGFADLEPLTSQANYAGLTSASSTSLVHRPPPLQKQDTAGFNPYFLDENLRLMALRQILDLSKQQHTFSLLEINRDNSPVGPRMPGIHVNPLNITNKGDIYDDALKPFHRAYSSGMLDQRDISVPLTGKCADCSCLNNQSNTSTSYPSPLVCKITESQLFNNLRSLHNSMRSLNNTQPSKHIRCNQLSSSTNHQSNCFCSAQPDCVGENFQTKFMCSCNSFMEEKGKVSNGPSSLVTSEAIPAENTPLSNQTEMVKGQNPRDICHTFQWKDVPCKKAGFEKTCKETSIQALDGGGNENGQLENKAGKHCGGDGRFLETSNISTGCSAPAATQTSAEVFNKDSSTVEVADTGHVDNSIVDEGSGIEKFLSPDEVFESEKSTEYRLSGTRALENDGSIITENLSSRSLLDELKILNSMTWKRRQNQIHIGRADYDNRDTEKHPMALNIGKGKRSIKFPEPYGNCSCQRRKKRRCAFSSAEMFSRKRNWNELYGDNEDKCGYQVKSHGHAGSDESLDVFSGNRYQADLTSTAFRQPGMHVQTRALPSKTVMYDLLSCRKVPSCEQSSVFEKARPVVYGKYGEISNGVEDGSLKPPKIVSLSLILKSAHKSTISKTCKPKVTNTRKLMGMTDKGKEPRFHKNRKFKILDDFRSYDVSNCDTLYLESTLVKKSACTSRNVTSDEYNMQKKDKGSGFKELKAKYKEVRKRSLYELIMEGKNSGPENSFLEGSSNGEQAVEVGREKSEGYLHKSISAKLKGKIQGNECLPRSESKEFCSVCGGSNKDDVNNLLECSQCFIRVHQACYGISRVPKGRWYCRPCQINAKDVACVLCGYGGGAMTRALKSSVIVKGLLKAWNIDLQKKNLQSNMDSQMYLSCISNFKVQNSITAGLLDNTVIQWVHMVCGLWTPGTRCPNVDTMSAFDVSGALRPRANVVCTLCRQTGGSCIKCRVKDCSVHFHSWCAHQKGLLQIEVEGVDHENLGFYGRCILHTTKGDGRFENQSSYPETGGHGENEPTCARTKGYKGCKRDGLRHNRSGGSDGKQECLVPQEQLNAWVHINRVKKLKKKPSHSLKVEVEHDCRNLQKEYAGYKQAKGWKHLVVYKSGIHALGLYTSEFICRGKMVVEYVGEIVGPRVADKREIEYQSGRRLQYKSACYFFRIDKEHIIDATRKGGIARFVNHSCLPNCVAKVISVKDEKKVVFFAERDIFPGEEITYDYHFNHEDEGRKIPCFCNSKNCKRYLN